MTKNLLRLTSIFFVITCCLFSFDCKAQSAAPDGVGGAPTTGTHPGSTMNTASMWDVLFNYNINSVTGIGGYAGVAFVNNEFWITKWQSDTITILGLTGNLIRKISMPAIDSIRAITTDGTNLYLGRATNSFTKTNTNSTTPSVL